MLITGGTGFLGRSLLTRWQGPPPGFDLVTILTRNSRAFTSAWPPARGLPWLELVDGNVLDIPIGLGRFEGIVHAAWSSDLDAFGGDPEALIDANVRGTKNVLAFAAQLGPVPVLFTSSGAVYGAQPAENGPIAETRAFSPHAVTARTAYSTGKRQAELACIHAGSSTSVRPKIARMFAFIGPHLPLGLNFAAGNFVLDALSGNAIIVKGDGKAVRSYLYSDDMADWLWAILERGSCQPYNVGSERAISVAELAHLIARRSGGGRVEVRVLGEPGPEGAGSYYVPATQRICEELDVIETIGLEQAVDRTLDFHKSAMASP